MQFNPACLMSGSPVGSSSQNNTPPHTPQQVGTPPEYLGTPTSSYSDGPPQQGSWSASVLGLPVYGIYNASLIPVPDANQANEAAKKKTPVSHKRPSRPSSPQKQGDSNAMDEVPTDDKFQGLDEEQKQKRQRRLIKNREAAQQFRQRQKEYIQNLERRVTELNNHVGETHKHIELLTAENRLLRDQLVYLYNVMRQNLSLSSPVPQSPYQFQAPLSISVPQSPSITPNPTPPASPSISPFMTMLPQTQQSLAPQMLDLSMLKGYTNMVDSNVAFEIFKAQAALSQMQGQPPTQSPPPSAPSTPTSLPDLGSMKLDLENAMLSNDSQTVPVFVKNEQQGGVASL